MSETPAEMQDLYADLVRRCLSAEADEVIPSAGNFS